jgi:hypothetical protein
MRLLRQHTAMDVGAGLAPGAVAAFVFLRKPGVLQLIHNS